MCICLVVCDDRIRLSQLYEEALARALDVLDVDGWKCQLNVCEAHTAVYVVSTLNRSFYPTTS